MKIAETPHEGLPRVLGAGSYSSIEGTDKIMQSEISFLVDGISGRIDVLYPDSGRFLDIKTSRWITPSKLPYGSHAFQVNIYANLLEKLGHKINRLQIQYLDMSGPTKCRTWRIPVELVQGEFRCPSCLKVFSEGHLGAKLVEVPLMDSSEIEANITERRNALQKALTQAEPPEREQSFLCSYFSARDICRPTEVE